MPPAVQMKADAIVVSPLTSIICNYIYHQSVYVCIFSIYIYSVLYLAEICRCCSYRICSTNIFLASLSFIYLFVSVYIHGDICDSGLSRTKEDVVVDRPQDDCWSNYRTNRRPTKDSSDSQDRKFNSEVCHKGRPGNGINEFDERFPFRFHPASLTPDSPAFLSFFSLLFLLLNVFRAVTGWKTRFVDSRGVREDVDFDCLTQLIMD